jgi:hypothetical protein
MCPSFVVQSVPSGTGISWFDRKFDAVLDALVGVNHFRDLDPLEVGRY